MTGNIVAPAPSGIEAAATSFVTSAVGRPRRVTCDVISAAAGVATGDVGATYPGVACSVPVVPTGPVPATQNPVGVITAIGAVVVIVAVPVTGPPVADVSPTQGPVIIEPVGI